MSRKKLPPIGEHPAFRELVEMLKKQPQDRIDKLLEALEDENIMSASTSNQEEKARSQGETSHNNR